MTLSSLILGLVSMSITQYLRIDKNNTLSIFMLSGSIQFSIPFSFKNKSYIYQTNAFIQYKCNVKILIQIHFSISIISLFSVCDSTYDYRIQHPRQIQLLNPVLFVIQWQCDFTFYITVSHMTIEVDIYNRFSC